MEPKIVELRFFGGYTDKETRQILGKNLAKVRRDWEFARSWLYDRLDGTKIYLQNAQGGTGPRPRAA
jgi:DNA-directed RNA polymerase specialized sigma24 family protein